MVHRKNLGIIEKNRNKKSYALFFFILIYLLFLILSSVRERDETRETIKTSNAMSYFFFGTNFGHRHEHELVLDIAPIHKYS